MNGMVQKLEIVGAFRKRMTYPVNPDLMSLKVCSDGNECFLEVILATAPLEVVKLETDFISGDGFEEKFFDPKLDIVELADRFFELDPYSLINVTEGLFTDMVAQRINDEFNGSSNSVEPISKD